MAGAAAEMSAVEERISVASNWTLVWWRFRKHKLALASAAVLAVLYAIVLCPNFFSTQDPERTDARQASSRSSRSTSSTTASGPPGSPPRWASATR